MVTVRIGDKTIELTWEQWEERVRSGRIPEDAQVRIEAVTGDRFMAAGRLELYRSLRNDDRIAWQSSFNSGGPPIVTALLVGAQIRLYWLAWIPDVEYSLGLFFTNWTAPALEDGQVWRLITMGFTHTDTFHLLLNMLWLAYTGWNLERALGWKNMVTLYLASVLGGSLLSMYASATTRSLGASGGIFGLVAASVAFGFARPDIIPERARRAFGIAMLPYLVLMFWSGLRNDGTDNWSHFGGLVVGGLLVLLMDPEPLQRTARWNTWARGATLAVGGLIIAGLGIAGPRAYLLEDSQAVANKRLAAQVRDVVIPQIDEYRSVEFSVPIGWGTGVLSSGDLGFRSPSPFGERGWAVTERREDHPRDPDEIRSAWTEDLLRSAPEAGVGPLSPTTVAGRPGWEASVSIDGEGERTLHWRFAVRGLFELHELWEVDRSRQARMEPLAERLRASVVWYEPEELVLARDGVARRPGRWSERVELAQALAEWGEPEKSRESWEALLADRPDDPDALRGLLDLVRWYPEQFPDAEAVVTRVLDQRADGSMVHHISVTLKALDRSDLAIGLLEIAWAQSPGDTHLRRARRGFGLPSRSSSLTGDPLRPWNVANDPETGLARSQEEIDFLVNRPLTVAAARDAHARWSAERAHGRQHVLNALSDPAADLTTPLIVMRYGYVPSPELPAIEALLTEITAETPPSLWPNVVVDAWTPEATRRLEDAIRDLQPDEPTP